MAVRQNLLDAISSTLQTVNDINSVTINRPMAQDFETVTMPAAFIYSGQSKLAVPDYQTIGYETYEWLVFIEIYGHEDLDLEKMLADVHTALFTNQMLGGYAMYSQVTGTDMLEAVSSDRSFSGLLIEFSVMYRHVQGQP